MLCAKPVGQGLAQNELHSWGLRVLSIHLLQVTFHNFFWAPLLTGPLSAHLAAVALMLNFPGGLGSVCSDCKQTGHVGQEAGLGVRLAGSGAQAGLPDTGSLGDAPAVRFRRSGWCPAFGSQAAPRSWPPLPLQEPHPDGHLSGGRRCIPKPQAETLS